MATAQRINARKKVVGAYYLRHSSPATPRVAGDARRNDFIFLNFFLKLFLNTVDWISHSNSSS